MLRGLARKGEILLPSNALGWRQQGEGAPGKSLAGGWLGLRFRCSSPRKPLRLQPRWDKEPSLESLWEGAASPGSTQPRGAHSGSLAGPCVPVPCSRPWARHLCSERKQAPIVSYVGARTVQGEADSTEGPTPPCATCHPGDPWSTREREPRCLGRKGRGETGWPRLRAKERTLGEAQQGSVLSQQGPPAALRYDAVLGGDTDYPESRPLPLGLGPQPLPVSVSLTVRHKIT